MCTKLVNETKTVILDTWEVKDRRNRCVSKKCQMKKSKISRQSSGLFRSPPPLGLKLQAVSQLARRMHSQIQSVLPIFGHALHTRLHCTTCVLRLLSLTCNVSSEINYQRITLETIIWDS